MVEFIAMIQKRLKIDKKHLDELRALQATWNPKWSDSGVSTLTSSLLSHISNEIADKERSYKEVLSRLEIVSAPPIDNSHSDFDPLEMLGNLEEAYENYHKCRDVISTPEAQKPLQKWYSSWKGADSAEMVMPAIDRDFRKATIRQQRAVDKAQSWYSGILPDVIERHQEYSETIKSFLQLVLTSSSSLLSNLSVSCSVALNSTAAFSSARFIAPLHDKSDKEGRCFLLQKCEYLNYMTDKQPAQPLVGFEGEQRVVLVNHVLDFGGLFFLSGQLSHLGQNLFTVLDLEKAYNYESFADFLKKVDAHLLIKATQIALCCDVPLVPILHEETSQYHKGIPRGKIRTIVDRIPEPIREEVLAITIKMIETSKFVQELHKIDCKHEVVLYLTHARNALPILEDIWRKWDCVKGCPLPEGVERVWQSRSMTSKVRWKKTGDEYSATDERLSC